MIKLLIISDDFTGALDTSVHFAQEGARTKVVFEKEYVFTKDDEMEVIVIDAETRHVPSSQAYNVIYHIVKRGMEAGIEFFYLKTDSALRGNIGSSLQAMSDAYGGKMLPFIPAYPKMNRLTIKGIQYIDNVKVGDSVFGKDPFNPVMGSSVSEIIAQQTDLPCVEVHSGSPVNIPEVEEASIVIYDSVTDMDIMRLADQLNRTGELRVMAGCAGFASVLPGIFRLKNGRRKRLELKPGIFVASGSVNPITLNQISYAVEHGFRYISVLDMIRQVLLGNVRDLSEMKELKELAGACRNHQYLIIDSSDYYDRNCVERLAGETGLGLQELRERIPGIFGKLLKELFCRNSEVTLMVTGGDTLMGFLETIGTSYMEPVEEIMPGIVISIFTLEGRQYHIITKSGGFGEKDLFIRLTSYMNERERHAGTV